MPMFTVAPVLISKQQAFSPAVESTGVPLNSAGMTFPTVVTNSLLFVFGRGNALVG